LASAYAVFANGGFKIEPYLIDRITDEDGDTLLQAKPVQACGLACDKDTIDPDLLAPQVLSSDVAFLMDTALKDVVQHGTARAAKVLNRQDIGGKTGTTNDQVDTWFAGYQNDLVVTTWIGHDSPTSVHEYAAQLALPLWIDFMRVALKDKPEAEVRLPENVIALHINPKTGLIAPENGNETVVEYFREEDVPVSDDDSTTVDVAPMVDTDEHLF
jgi:penicillin-binding protein 1A